MANGGVATNRPRLRRVEVTAEIYRRYREAAIEIKSGDASSFTGEVGNVAAFANTAPRSNR